MDFFGNSKKNDGGGFGLPSFSLGKSGKTLDQGLGKASNTLRNTGVEVNNFLFGETTNKKDNSGLPIKDNAAAGIGFGLPDISLGKAGKTLDQGLGKASNTLRNTGVEVDNLLFGKSKSQKDKNGLAVELPGLGGISLKNGGSSSLTGTFNKIGVDLDKTGSAVEKTGESYLFGNNKNKVEGPTESTNMLGLALPGLSFGGTSLPSLSDVGKKVEDDIGKVGSGVQKQGKKVVDYFFRGGNKKQTTPVGVTERNIILPKPNLPIRATNLFGENGNGEEKAGAKVVDNIFGGKPKTTIKPGFGGIGLDLKLPKISDVGKKVDADIRKVGSGVQQEGKKVVDYFFGGGNNKQTTPVGVTEGNILLPKPNLSIGPTNLFGEKGNREEKAGAKVMDNIFGGKAKTTIQPGFGGIGLDDKLPKISSPPHPFGGLTISPGASDVTGNIQDNLQNLKTGVEKTGGKVVDYLFGGNHEPTIPSISLGGNPNSSQTLSISGTSSPSGAFIQGALGKLGKGVEKTGEKVVDLLHVGGKEKSIDSLPTSPIPISNKAIDVTATTSGNNPNIHQTESTLPPSPTTNVEDELQNIKKSNGSFLIDGITVSSEHKEGTFEIPNVNELTTIDGLNVSYSINNNENDRNLGSPINSSEESVIGLFGTSEVSTSRSTKSGETLKRIEDILQGSGQITTTLPIRTGQAPNKMEEEVSIKPNQTLSNSQGFANNREVSYEVTTAAQMESSGTPIVGDSENSTTSKPGPLVVPPYFIVPNRNSTIGEQFTPQMPPTVFDKPIDGKAPFIPILPPPLETTIKSITTPPPTIASQTLAPPISAAPSRSLTPVEYGSIGIGAVLIFALFAYIYQKYKQYSTSSTGGSYSPKAHHRSTAGGKRRSNDSGGGQSLDVEEANETIITTPNTNDVISEVTVVDIVSEIKTTEEVIEIPVTKTVVNGLQKSSTNELQAPQPISGKGGNFHETISEKQNSAMEKPPRKTKTPTNSPEKFTSDKTSASHLNSDSLITVSQAIGGILRSQASDHEETDDIVESNGDSGEEGISLLGRLAESSAIEIVTEDADSDEATFEEPIATNDVPVTNGTNEPGPLYTSLETEMDAGSEYFSADENSDIKNSPPLSPSLKETFKSRTLRAEDVYNTEIITEDGRRRSIEEDIADSIDNKSDHNLLDGTIVAPTENCSIHSEPVPFSQTVSSEDMPISTNNIEHDYCKDEYYDLRRQIYIQNLINAEKSNYRNEGAEAIVDDILRASQLDSLTIQSIRKDLGTSTETKPRVRWSDNIQSRTIIDSNSEICPIENYDLVSSSETDNRMNTDEDKAPNINHQDPIPHKVIGDVDLKISEASTQNMNQNPINSLMGKNVEQTGLENKNTQEVADSDHQTQKNVPARVAVNSASTDEPDINHSDDQCGSKTEENLDSIDEGFPVEHRFEFIPPKQPQIFEDDLIVFSNSDRESISTLSNSTAGSNGPNEEQCSGDKKVELEIQDISSTSNICEDCGGIRAGELVADTSNGLESINIKGNVTENHTKWYVPNDEMTEADLINGEQKAVEGLYIFLTEEVSKPTASKDHTELESLPQIHPSPNSPSSRPNKETRNFSNISYAYIDVNDDPKNEGWPGHLPKNIHSISGVSLFKNTEAVSSSCDVLKEEVDIPTSVITGGVTTIEECERTTSGVELSGTSSTSGSNHQKPVPKFIMPNMDARLSKKRSSRRRQIKSLDSGVHHYYGEYFNLVNFPETEIEGGAEKIEKETEEVIIIKPDGTITEERIVIENTH